VGFIPVSTPRIEDADREAVLRCLESGWLSSEGPQVAQFEDTFAHTVERRHGIAVSSGTAALGLAVRALGLGAGDEILVPSLTIISCAQAIVQSGATPVPVDCGPTDWNARLQDFQERLTPRTKALMLVHLYGLCSDLDPILSWAAERGLMVIEDASQAHGLLYKGRPCGSFGDISVFSLYANKLVTTGEGGMIVCTSERWASRCRSLRNLCFTPERRFWHEELGWNYRLTSLQASLGLSQMGRLPELARRQRTVGQTYHRAFRELDCFQLAPPATDFAENGYWVFAMAVALNAPFSRDAILSGLADERIGTRTFFYGLHQQPALLNPGHIAPVSLPVTESASARGFYVPSGVGLSAENQQRVIDSVKRVVERLS
jgi:perosamine synthetase